MRIVTIEDFVDIRKFLALAKEVYEANKAKGFWDQPRSPEHCLMLVISEIAEAVEAARKEGDTPRVAYYKELIAAGSEAIFERKAEFKDSVIDEMADTVIRCLDIVGYAADSHLLEDYIFHVDNRIKWLNEALLSAEYAFGLEVGLPEFTDFCFELTQGLEVIDGWSVDVAIDCMRIIGQVLAYVGHSYRLSLMPEAITTKLAYNAQRPRLHGKAF